MREIRIVSAITFKEGVRDRIFVIFFVFAALLIVFSLVLSLLVVGQQQKVIADFGLAVMALFSLLITVFVGTSTFNREIERKTLVSVLSKPLRRWEFMVGKLLGILEIVGLNLFFMVLLLYLLLLSKNFSLPTVFLQAFLTLLEMAVVASFSLVFSSFTTPFLSMLFTLSFYVIGHLTATIKGVLFLVKVELIKKFLLAVFYVFPNLERFNLRNQIVYGIDIPAKYLVLSIVYALLLTLAFTLLAIVIFEKRDV